MQSLQSRMAWYQRVQWVLGLTMLGGVAGFYFLGYRPTQSQLKTLHLQIESRQRELDQNQNKARNLRILTDEVRDLEHQVQNHGRRFPSQPELGEFIRDLTQISQQMALRGWRYRPGAPKRSEAFYELPIQMQMEGDFLSIVSFLRQVEDLPRLTRVQRLNVKSKDSRSGNVEVDLAMSIYFAER